jgi:flagellar motility protein MotE (MotC chaperone)
MKRIASATVACLFFLALASPAFAQGSQMQEGKMPQKTNMMQGSEAETGGYMHHMTPEMMQQCRKTHEEYAKNLASVQAQIEQSKNQKNTNERLDTLTAALDTLVKSMETRQQGCPGAQRMMQGGQGMMHGGQGMMQGGQGMMQRTGQQQ